MSSSLIITGSQAYEHTFLILKGEVQVPTSEIETIGKRYEDGCSFRNNGLICEPFELMSWNVYATRADAVAELNKQHKLKTQEFPMQLDKDGFNYATEGDSTERFHVRVLDVKNVHFETKGCTTVIGKNVLLNTTLVLTGIRL